MGEVHSLAHQDVRDVLVDVQGRDGGVGELRSGSIIISTTTRHWWVRPPVLSRIVGPPDLLGPPAFWVEDSVPEPVD